MRVLGIDPGTRKLGYGVVEGERELKGVAWGVLTASPQIPVEERLRVLYNGLSDVILRYRPQEVAIEDPFVGKNVRSAFAVGRAQTVAILAVVNQGLGIHYYSPALVKQQVTGYGRSDKRQVQEMVKLQLELSEYPQPSDAADALAIAICHLQQNYLNRWVNDRGIA
ncbi:MAG: crossover junction endodeoxyribonuclease RuvC [Dehalococcoidia bacterium]|nr:crossover junction endodeoxyribonuclease RuvC [Dehalococcoidia bacterium]